MPNKSISNAHQNGPHPYIVTDNSKTSRPTNHRIASVEARPDSEKNFFLSSVPRIRLPFLSWFQGFSPIKPGGTDHPQSGYPTDALLLQVGEVSSELSQRLAPSLQLPFSLKGKKRLAIGAGILMGAAGGSLAAACYARYTPPPPQEDLQPASSHALTPGQYHANMPYIPPLLQSESLVLESEKKTASNIVAGQNNLINFLKKKGVIRTPVPEGQVHLSKEMLIEAVAEYLYQDSGSHLKNTVRLAKNILSEEDLYGGRKGETVSFQVAQSVISRWLFDNVLGTVLAEHVAKKIFESEYPHYFTISSLKKILDLNTLFKDGVLDYHSISASQWGNFNRFWYEYLDREIPLFKLPGEEIDSIPLNSQEFIELYSGSIELIKKNNQLIYIPISEIRLAGQKAWYSAISNELEISNIPLLLLPVLIDNASNKNFSPTKKNNRLSIYIDKINDYAQYVNQISSLTQESINKFDQYKNSVTRWMSKIRLADDIIKNCTTYDTTPRLKKNYPTMLPTTPGIIPMVIEEVIMPVARDMNNYISEQAYLDNFKKPCDTAPDNLSDEYKKLTEDVASDYYQFDKSLISLTLLGCDKHERNFIYSRDAKITPVDFNMVLTRPLCFHRDDCLLSIRLHNTNLLSITAGNEERIYALKNKGNETSPSYQLSRVDYDIRNYIKNNLIDFTHPVTEYQVADDLIIGHDRYHFTIKPQDKHIKIPKDENDPVAHYLATIHKDSFYNNLYSQGNDKSDLQKIWSITKHFIPFYDCIESSVEGKVSEAVPSCLIDIISLIPTAGLALHMGQAFGSSLMQGIYTGSRATAQGGLQHATRALMHELRLPAAREFIQLGKSSIKFIDPGFELIGSGARLLGKKVRPLMHKVKDNVSLTAKMPGIRQKIQTPSSQQNYIMAQMPDSTIKAPVKRLTTKQGGHTYVMVNPATGELFGKHYQLVGDNQLELIKKNIYPQKTRPIVSRMDQELPQLNYERRAVDISHIPAENMFLPTAAYYPLHARLGLPHVDISIQPHLSHDFTYGAVTIKNYIMQSYAQNDIFLCRFNQQLQEIPAAFANLRNNLAKYKADINLAKKQVNSLRKEIHATTMRNVNNQLTFPATGHRIAAYLSKVLHLDTLEDTRLANAIKREAMERLDFHTKKISEYLNNEINNIYFASSDTALHPYLHHSDSPMAFVYKEDDFRRVVIMADNFHTAPILSTNMHLTALHEISHFSGTFDFQIAPSTSLVGDASEFMESFSDGIHGVKGEFIDVSDSVLDIYHQAHPDRLIDKMQFIELLKRDPMLRANIFMENADFLAKFISDLGSRTPANHDLLKFKKRSVPADSTSIIKVLLQILT